MNYHLTISNLRDNGYKITDVRRAIVDVFSTTNKPLSAGKLYELLRVNKHSLNKTTIYREIQFLLDNNYLTEVFLTPKEKSYESADLIHHHHLVCNNCGKVDTVTNCLVKELEKHILKTKGFRIEKHNLEFYGICAACLKKI